MQQQCPGHAHQFCARRGVASQRVSVNIETVIFLFQSTTGSRNCTILRNTVYFFAQKVHRSRIREVFALISNQPAVRHRRVAEPDPGRLAEALSTSFSVPGDQMGAPESL